MDINPIWEGDSYVTGPGRGPSVVSRLCGSLGIPFILYPGTLRIVLRDGFIAKTGRYSDDKWARGSRDVVRELEKAGVRLEISGLNNIGKLKWPGVIIGNHMSILETFVLPAMIRPHGEVTFVVKRSLMNYPVFGPVMRSRNPVVVDRQNPRKDYAVVMKEGEKRLMEGKSVVIFPQTTRTTEFEPEMFNSMGVKLARRAGVPVLPVVLKTDAWKNARHLKEFGRLDPSRVVRFQFGEPIRITGNGAVEHEMIKEFITERLFTWGRQG